MANSGLRLRAALAVMAYACLLTAACGDRPPPMAASTTGIGASPTWGGGVPSAPSAPPPAVPVEPQPTDAGTSSTAPAVPASSTPPAAAASDPAQGDADDGADAGGATPPLGHEFFATARVDEYGTLTVPSEGDLWVSCWSDDDALYVASGDGRAFAQSLVDLAVSRITGHPADTSDPLVGITLAVADQVASIWDGLNYNRKPTGMLCRDGDLYLAVQDLRTFTYDDAPNATIVRSNDKGLSWSWDKRAPMFSDNVFTTIMFLDYGKNGEHAIDDFVYVYALDHNWAYNGRLGAPTSLYLARVPKDAVQDRTRYQFFAGIDRDGQPTWTSEIAQKEPVLEDDRRVYTMPIDPELSPKNMTVLGQGSIVYNAPLRRYIYTSWTEFTWEFYEAPQPWGPWTLFFSKDFGAYPWHARKNGGYATTIPSKFISADGLSMYVQSNTWGDSNVTNYDFSLRALRVTPYVPGLQPTNRAGPTALSSRPNAVPIARAFRNGSVASVSDRVSVWQSEDSFTGDAKDFDYWGYVWDEPLHLNALVYANGDVTAHGGWFETLSVEVRRDQKWVPVDTLSISPAYTFGPRLPVNGSYTLRFAETVADGIRVAGRPGGDWHYTSIAELAVYYLE